MRFGILALLLIACRQESSNEVVVYVALDLYFSEPILQDFEKQTGIKVKIISDTEATKTTGLVNRLIAYKDKPEGDVFWNNEIVRTIVLKRKGVLEPYVPTTSSEIPAAFKDKDGYWVGFAARGRIILYNKNLVQEAPKSLNDFLKPEWKGRFTLANPLFGTTGTHVAAMFATMGPDAAKKLLRDLKSNGLKISPGNAMARNMVQDGEIPACFTDTDDANGAFLKNKPVEMVWPEGALLIPNTVAMVKGAPHQENAKKLIDYIASREVEARLAKSGSAQIPLRPGIPAPSDKFSIAGVKMMAVDWERVADVLEESTKFVQDEFLK